MLKLKMIGLLCLSALLISCDEDEKRVGSSGISTGQFYSTFAVIDDGSGDIYAEAQLTRGAPAAADSEDGLYIDLEYGDSLWLSNGSDSIYDLELSDHLFDQALYHSDKHEEFRSANDIRDEVYFLFVWRFIVEWGTFYSVTYDRPRNEENTYTVSLARDHGDDIYSSRVEMPSAFEIASPSTGTTFDRENEALEIVWTNISTNVDQIQLTASTTCADGSFDEITQLVAMDEGGYTFEAGDLDSELLSGVCNLSLTVAKVNLGDLNGSFSGGIIQGQQVRRLSLRSQAF